VIFFEKKLKYKKAKSQQNLDFVLGKQVSEQPNRNPVAALNGALKSEMQRLKMATGQAGNQMMNFAEPPHTFGGANQQVFHHPGQAVPPFLVAMQQQQQLLLPHMNQPLHPLQSQQLHQVATLSIDMEGLPVAPPGQWQWGGDTWSESSSS
jgi:hypothetical protein